MDVNQVTSQEIRKAARFKGLAYYTRYDDVCAIESDEIASETRFLRIYLDVPYAEKDSVKSAGARWDASQRVWYGTPQGSNLEGLQRWTPREDRIPVYCPPEHIQYAMARGAQSGEDGSLYVPAWYWLSSLLRHDVTSLCYWLPSEHEEYRTFTSHEKAAEWISLNGGYVPAIAYLPEERAHLEHLCRTCKEIYYFQDSRKSKASYFRWSKWDSA